VIRRLFKWMVKVGAAVGATVLVAKMLDQYRGSPPGVGDESLRFSAETDEDPYAIDEATLGGEVSPDLLERLVCPLDKGPLELVDGKWLVNHRNGYRYPISDGIPIMLVEVGERYRDPSLITQPQQAEPTDGEDAGSA
jgi:uncharacterized protein YbaR (Trm112 family)